MRPAPRPPLAACLCGALLLSVAACERAPADDRASAGALAEAPAPTQPIDGRFDAAQMRQIRALAAPTSPPRDETNEVSGDPIAARLGQALFYDERLSADGTVSCASCHHPERAFGMPAHFGIGQQTTPRHPPALLNVAYQRWFDWDGKSDSLWSQAARPLESAAEHGSSRAQIARLIATDPRLRRGYLAAFPDHELPSPERARQLWPAQARPVPEDPEHAHQRAWDQLPDTEREAITRVFTHALKAIAAYEERLVVTDTPLDRLARGEASPEEAMSLQARRGLELFLGQARCVTCHNGPLLSDMAFHNLGLGARPWIEDPADEGRWEGAGLVRGGEFRATGRWSAQTDGERAQWLEYLRRTREDHGQFKTPGLRGVALSAPYMHGGHFETLEDVVAFYDTLPEGARVGHREEALRPLGLTPQQRRDLVAFLRQGLTPEPLEDSLLGPPEGPLAPAPGSHEVP